MMKQILAAIFFASSAFAGLPPTTIKGQKDASPFTTFNFQVPNSQATAVTGGRLIETGNKNVLVNPGFEGTTAVTGWVVGNATPALETLRTYGGKQALKLTTSSQTGEILRQTLSGATGTGSINPSFSLLQMTGSAYVWNQSFTGLQMCVGLWDGTSVFTDQQCQSIPATTGYVRVPLAFLTISSLTTQSYGIRFKTTATETAAVYIDDVELKPAELGLSSPDTVWNDAVNVVTATTTAPTKGTVQWDHAWWKRNGSSLDVRIEYGQGAAGTAGSGDYLWAIPAASGCTIDQSKVTFYQVVNSADGQSNVVGTATFNISGTVANTGYVRVYDSTRVRLFYASGTANGLNNSSNFQFSQANDYISATFSVPCAGWTPQTAIATQNSNYDWRPYTPTFTGFGTPTGVSCREKREGPDNLVDCAFTTGTTTATTASMTLPYTVSSTLSSGYHDVGKGTQGANQAQVVSVLTQAGQTTVNFSFNNVASVGPLTPQNGSSFNSSMYMNIVFRYTVAGWSENQNAPQLIGSVVTDDSSVTKVAWARFTNNGTTAAKAAGSTCFGTPTRTATGRVTVAINSGCFSDVPSCSFAMYSTVSVGFVSLFGTPSATSLPIATRNGGNTDVDEGFAVTCTGPK